MKKIYTKDGNFALVDDECFEELNKYNWNQDYNGYFKAYVKQEVYIMHRMVTNCPKGLIVHHINSIKTDNRKENLRICTRQQNGYNCKPSFGKKYKGVSYDDHKEKWMARVTHKDINYICGFFDTEKEAVIAYNEKSREFRGEYAYQNPI